METFIWYMLAAGLGGVLGTIVPYVLKAWKNGGLKFDYTYFYGLCISTVIACAALIPETDIVDTKMLFIVFLAGLGLNTIGNKLNTARIKRNGG